MQYIEFTWQGLHLTAIVSLTAYTKAKLSGSPESCFPEEGGEIEFESLTVGDSNAMFLLGADCADDIQAAAYEAAYGQQQALFTESMIARMEAA